MKKNELKKIIVKIFINHKLNKLHAEICAEALINAELVGSPSHGLSRLKMYCDRINKKVIYPKFHDGIFRERVVKYLNKGYGSLVGFEVDGGLDVGKEFINNLKLIYHVANIGDARTLAIHPASTTHSQLSPEDQIKAGVTPGYIRISVGIEHIDDIIEDIDQALNKSLKKFKNVA